MDGLLHQVGKDSDQVDDQAVEWYEERLRELMALAREHYGEVRLFICSDHGMATVERIVDIGRRSAQLGLDEGRDYVATYDSTMARFWFYNDTARAPDHRTAGDDTRRPYPCRGRTGGTRLRLRRTAIRRTDLPAHAGVIIVPSHMGTKPITGMHGYHPDHPDSDASLLSNVPPPVRSECITDLFHLMRAESGADRTAGKSMHWILNIATNYLRFCPAWWWSC